MNITIAWLFLDKYAMQNVISNSIFAFTKVSVAFSYFFLSKWYNQYKYVTNLPVSPSLCRISHSRSM